MAIGQSETKIDKVEGGLEDLQKKLDQEVPKLQKGLDDNKAVLLDKSDEVVKLTTATTEMKEQQTVLEKKIRGLQKKSKADLEERTGKISA
jgi:predicted  nucleic acid-binding Zn-ribbon protein